MRLNRRLFIRLIPAAAIAVAGGSWWTFTEKTKERVDVSPITGTSESTSILNDFVFPVTWNEDQQTIVNLNDYRLSVDGDVPKPLDLTLADLQSMPQVQKAVKIQCVTGWEAEVLWEGVPLSYLLTQAGASLKDIASVAIESVRGYKTQLSSDFDQFASQELIIALKAGGFPLTIEHGFPARLVAPARLGLDWVKGARRITCTNK